MLTFIQFINEAKISGVEYEIHPLNDTHMVTAYHNDHHEGIPGTQNDKGLIDTILHHKRDPKTLVGYTQIGSNLEKGPHAYWSFVHPKYRRLGVAGDMYNKYTTHTGHNLIPGYLGNDTVKKFWKKRLQETSLHETMISGMPHTVLWYHHPQKGLRVMDHPGEYGVTHAEWMHDEGVPSHQFDKLPRGRFQIHPSTKKQEGGVDEYLHKGKETPAVVYQSVGKKFPSLNRHLFTRRHNIFHVDEPYLDRNED